MSSPLLKPFTFVIMLNIFSVSGADPFFCSLVLPVRTGKSRFIDIQQIVRQLGSVLQNKEAV